jgi:protocatechuate 3,4-dioxygenase alpha subunit
VSPELTPAQTVGPYLAIGLPWAQGPVADAAGVKVFGRVLDGAGEPLPDALVETWDPAARAFARCPTDDDGAWFVVTPPAPFLAVNVLARGLLHRVVTRICFDEAAIPDGVPADRRHTLLARPEGDGHRFDIHLQGPDETVFFDV